MITAIVTFAIAYVVVVMAHFANIEAILSGSGRKR